MCIEMYAKKTTKMEKWFFVTPQYNTLSYIDL